MKHKILIAVAVISFMISLVFFCSKIALASLGVDSQTPPNDFWYNMGSNWLGTTWNVSMPYLKVVAVWSKDSISPIFFGSPVALTKNVDMQQDARVSGNFNVGGEISTINNFSAARITSSRLRGTGSAYVCADYLGNLFRSEVPCR